MDKTLMDLRKSFVGNAKGNHSNAYGGLIFTDGQMTTIGGHPCHGFLGTSYYHSYQRKNVDVQYILSAIRSDQITDHDTARDFYNWLFNDSPWHSVFIEKSYDKALTHGVVGDPSAPANLLASGMIASRFMTETYASDQQYRRPIYKELREAGFSQADAFVFAHMFVSENPAKKLYPVKFSRFSSGHSVFPGQGAAEGYFRNFFNSTPYMLTEPLGRTGYKAGTLNSVWGDYSGKDGFGQWCSTVAPTKKKVAKDYHIFRAKPKDSYLIQNRADFVEVVLKIKERIYA